MSYASTAQAGPIGLAVVVVLGIAVVFLGRSLIHHLNKVPESFDRPGDPADPPADPPRPDREA